MEIFLNISNRSTLLFTVCLLTPVEHSLRSAVTKYKKDKEALLLSDNFVAMYSLELTLHL